MDNNEPLLHPEEKPKNPTITIPPIQIHEKAPIEKLSEENRIQLLEQYRLFWTLRYKKPVLPDQDSPSPKVYKGDLFHNMHYQPDILRSVLRTGVMSGEVGDGIKDLIPEDSETHFCADFFVIPNDLNIDELVSLALKKVKQGNLIKGTPAEYSFPKVFGTSYSMSLILEGNSEDQKKLFELSGTSLDYEKIKDFVHFFPTKDEYITHKAVIVGIPANFIKKIIISKYMSLQPEIIKEIKEIINESGLNIGVFDTEGNLLNSNL